MIQLPGGKDAETSKLGITKDASIKGDGDRKKVLPKVKPGDESGNNAIGMKVELRRRPPLNVASDVKYAETSKLRITKDASIKGDGDRKKVLPSVKPGDESGEDFRQNILPSVKTDYESSEDEVNVALINRMNAFDLVLIELNGKKHLVHHVCYVNHLMHKWLCTLTLVTIFYSSESTTVKCELRRKQRYRDEGRVKTKTTVER
ncbi:hypothetical protein L6452_39312 [Arctium lappa]|uniref:Uncharacterized protein n=1 Tax=Arctium lappa TaxID=4217 RepID=A0ACB8XSL5_ARCLA|nr:hypothetical protein L6452_39312 [Arctium lappa]